MNRRWAAIGGIVGPVAFIGGWAVTGIATDAYSAVDDAISDLAEVHASTRAAMTTAFVVFAVGMCFYAWALRAALPGPAWVAAAIAGVATAGVAAFPLEHSSTVDALHGVCAGVGYVGLAATALLAIAPLARAGCRTWARGAAVAGSICAVALLLTLAGSAHGLFQRVGLTAGDVWIIASAAAILRGSQVSAA